MDLKWEEIKPGYRVSNTGRVQSCVTRGRTPRVGTEWRDLKLNRLKSGHLQVWLGRGDCRYVHALVLEAFVGPCPPGMEACHFPDRDPSNNRLDNLRWGTRKENYEDSVKHGTAFLRAGERRGEDHPYAKLDEPTVRIIMTLRNLCDYGSRTICVFLDLDTKMQGAVDGIIRGQSWNHVTGLPPYKPQSSIRGRRPRAA